MISNETVCPPGLPDHLWEGIRRYVLHGLETGSFLEALFAGKLFEVYARGDDQALGALRELVMYVYNECPSRCQGSAENVRRWKEHGGLAGLKG